MLWSVYGRETCATREASGCGSEVLRPEVGEYITLQCLGRAAAVYSVVKRSDKLLYQNHLHPHLHPPLLYLFYHLMLTHTGHDGRVLIAVHATHSFSPDGRQGLNLALKDVAKVLTALSSAPQKGFLRDVISLFVNEWYAKPSLTDVLSCRYCLEILDFIVAGIFRISTHLDSFPPHTYFIQFCPYCVVFQTVSRENNNDCLVQSIWTCQ